MSAPDTALIDGSVASPPAAPLRSRGRWRPVDTSVSLVTVLVIAVLVVTPLAYLVYGSLRTLPPGAANSAFTGANWKTALNSSGLLYLRNTVVAGLVTAALSMVMGTVLAWLVTRTDLPCKRKLNTFLLVPLLFSPLLSTLAWIGLAGPRAGLLNIVYRSVFGHGQPFNIFSFPGMILVMVAHYTPYVFLAVRGVMVNVDKDLESASRVLGGSSFMTARRITVPMVAPALLSSGLLVFVLSADNFTVPSLLGVNFGYVTLPYALYSAISGYPYTPGLAAAYGLVLVIVTTLGMGLYLRTVRSAKKYVAVSGKGNRTGVTRLTWWGKTVGLIFCFGYLVIAVVLPYATLLLGAFSKYLSTASFSLSLLTLSQFRELFASPQVMSALRNSVELILLTATIATLLSVLVAWVSVRSRSRLRFGLDFLSALPAIIPGVALGLGLLWQFLYIKVGLYGTIGAIVIAFVTQFLGHGSRISSAALLQVNPDLEQAAMTLGSTRTSSFLRVTLPALRAPLASAWVLIAILASIEVSAAMSLFTGSTEPLSVFVFITSNGGQTGEAFAAGALLMTVTLAIVSLAQWRLRVLEQV